MEGQFFKACCGVYFETTWERLVSEREECIGRWKLAVALAARIMGVDWAMDEMRAAVPFINLAVRELRLDPKEWEKVAGGLVRKTPANVRKAIRANTRSRMKVLSTGQKAVGRGTEKCKEILRRGGTEKTKMVRRSGVYGLTGVKVNKPLLTEARLAAGMTFDEVGDLLGVAGVTVKQWESGRSGPKEEILVEALAVLYGLDVELLTGTEEPGVFWVDMRRGADRSVLAEVLKDMIDEMDLRIEKVAKDQGVRMCEARSVLAGEAEKSKVVSRIAAALRLERWELMEIVGRKLDERYGEGRLKSAAVA